MDRIWASSASPSSSPYPQSHCSLSITNIITISSIPWLPVHHHHHPHLLNPMAPCPSPSSSPSPQSHGSLSITIIITISITPFTTRIWAGRRQEIGHRVFRRDPHPHIRGAQGGRPEDVRLLENHVRLQNLALPRADTDQWNWDGHCHCASIYDHLSGGRGSVCKDRGAEVRNAGGRATPNLGDPLQGNGGRESKCPSYS